MSARSSGGVASADFSLAELERARTFLGRTASDLGEAAGCLDGSLLSLAMLAASEDAALAATAEWQLRRASLLVRGAQAQAGILGEAVERSRVVYEETEQRVRRLVNEARAALLPLILAHDLQTNGFRPRTVTTEDLINQSPALVGTILPILFPASYPVAAQFGKLRDRAHGGLFETTVAERLYPRIAGVATDLEWVSVAPLEIRGHSSRSGVPFRGGMDDLLALQADAEPGRSGHGAMLVTTVATDRGTVHVLTLPGTQSESGAEGTNPWDGGGVVEGMGLGSQHVAAGALEALELVGAEPGDRLVLTGYSQGGIHAANLAVDPRVSAAYDVEYVVTAGSPVGGTPLPSQVRGLQLEHVDDPVPGTDGATNPNGRNQVTVYFDGYAPETDRAAGGFGAAHGLGNYAQQTRALADSEDPAVVEARAALGTVFAGAAVATVHTVRLGRAPVGGVPSGGAPGRRRATSRGQGPPSR